MNKMIAPLRPTNPRTYTQLVGFGFGAMAAVALTSAPVWPQAENIAPNWTDSSSTFSGFGQERRPTAANQAEKFERQLAAFYAEFIDGQEPLGPEFEAVWDANVRSLYES